MILISCGSNQPPFRHKALQIETRQSDYSLKLNNTYFTIVEARLNENNKGKLFVTEWSVRNTGKNKQRIRLSEKANQTYLLYGQRANKIPLYGVGIGTCERQRNCFSYINLLPNQTLTFVLKTPLKFLKDIDQTKPIAAKLRARFEIKEENFYTYPVDIEFNNLIFNPTGWANDYGKKQQ